MDAFYSTEFKEPKQGFGERQYKPHRIVLPGKKIGRELTFAGEKTDFLWIVMTAKKQVSFSVKCSFKDGFVRRRVGTNDNALVSDVGGEVDVNNPASAYDFKYFNLGQGTIKDKKKKLQEYLTAI